MVGFARWKRSLQGRLPTRLVFGEPRGLPGLLRAVVAVAQGPSCPGDGGGATDLGGGWQDLASQSRPQEGPGRPAQRQRLGQRVRPVAGTSRLRGEIQRNHGIPELLRLVDIKGTIITIDAMGTQKAIAAQIVDSGADYVLAVKGNQETLERGLLEHIDKHLDNDFAAAHARRHVTVEKGHGRQEVRTYVQMPVPEDLPEREKWKGLRTIGMATLVCTRDGRQTSEVRYFINSLPMGVKCFARAVRSHWGIENSCHWSLDMTYREDESRIHDRHVAENFAWLNRFTLSLLKQHPKKDSIAMKRRACGWSDDFLLQVLAGTEG